MRIGLVVDSVCELPYDYCRANDLVILPTKVRLAGHEFFDLHLPEVADDFYRNHLANAQSAETAPATAEEIEALFLERLVIDYDYVFCMITASARSPTFDNATQASLSILSRYKAVRAAAGVVGPFALRVIDTQNVFTAQAVLAVEAVRMVKAGETPNRIKERLDQLILSTYGYLLPRSLYHLRMRAAKKGDRSVGWVKYALGSALDLKPLVRSHLNETGAVASLRHFDDGAARVFHFLVQRMREGLLVPTVSLAYCGELPEMRKLPGYRDFITVARELGVEVLETVASVTAAVNVGEGSLGIGFCAPPHEFV